MDLCALAESYPNRAGYTDQDTSKAAAESMQSRVSFLQRKALEILRHGPRTADEIAFAAGVSALAMRPRLSELTLLGAVKDSGIRRVNPSSGKRAKAYQLV